MYLQTANPQMLVLPGKKAEPSCYPFCMAMEEGYLAGF